VGDLVLGDRRERQVLLDVGSPPGPLGVAVAQDQLVVGDGEDQPEARIIHGRPPATAGGPDGAGR
jgi:hypothetical protein